MMSANFNCKYKFGLILPEILPLSPEKKLPSQNSALLGLKLAY